MKLVDRVAFLKTTDLLAGVPDDILAQIGGDMEEIEAKTGTTVFRQGGRGDAVYLVVDGALSIERGGIQLVSLGRGECVGEFALIDGGPRSASAIAETDVLMLKWMREDFDTTISKNRAVVYGLFKILTGRLRRENDIRVEVVLEQERWRQDLKRAHEIQMGMLPEGDLITDHIEISGYCRPAADVGGDYYDYLLLEDDKLGIILGDVTDHGFYSGLFVAMAKNCLHTQATIDYAPEKVMEAMNRTVSMSIRSGMLMTCCYVLIDSRRHTLSYTNAGHNFPYHYSRRSDKLDPLPSTDMVLGVPGFEASGFAKQERSWEKGDLLLLYSDGITEAQDADGEMFEEERLRVILLQNRDSTPAQIKEAILQALARHIRSATPSDDITLAVAKAV